MSLGLAARLVERMLACSDRTSRPPPRRSVATKKRAIGRLPQPGRCRTARSVVGRYSRIRSSTIWKHDSTQPTPTCRRRVARFEQGARRRRAPGHLQRVSDPRLGRFRHGARAAAPARPRWGNLVGNVPVTSNDFLATLNLNWGNRLVRPAFAMRPAAAPRAGTEQRGGTPPLSLCPCRPSWRASISVCAATTPPLRCSRTPSRSTIAPTSSRATATRRGLRQATDVDQADTLRQNAPGAQLASVRREACTARTCDRRPARL